jgi:hypothetical protein
MLRPSSSLALLTVRHRPAAPEGVSTRAFRRFVTSSTVEYATRLTGQLPGLDFHQQEERPLSAAPTGRLALAPVGLAPTEHVCLLWTHTEPHAVRRVLAALGLAAEPPPGHAVGAA